MANPPAGFFAGVFVPPGLFVTQTVPGTAYNTSTTATKINGTLVNPKRYFGGVAGTFDGGKASTSANLNLLGRTLKIRASGTIANTATPNLTMEFRLGASILATTGVQATAAITGTVSWEMESTSVVTTAGASGIMISNGFFRYYTTAPVIVQWQVTNTVSGTGLSIDLTAKWALTCFATWGTSSASNTITCNAFAAEVTY